MRQLRNVGVMVALSLAAGTTASQDSIQLEVRHAPAVVNILGVAHLVHELWITNRNLTVVKLSAVTVLDADRAIARFDGPELSRRVGRPDLPRTHPTPLVVEPARAAVVYFWIPLDNGRPPERIRHRVEVTREDASAGLQALGGETAVRSEVEVLDPPLGGAGWTAVYDPAMMGGHRTAVYTVEGVSRIPGRFALDWIRLLPTGRAHVDRASRPADWNGFGADVLAVKDARVALAVDGHPDADASGKPREAITRENAAGNYLALDLGNGRYAFYEHLQNGSLAVKVGDTVARGQVVARVGSSGSVSSGPHLHFHVATAPSTLGAEGVPFVLRSFEARGAFASIDAFSKGEAPLPSSSDRTTRTHERPAPNAVVDFPSNHVVR
jgi:murein DD-endopeptidase